MSFNKLPALQKSGQFSYGREAHETGSKRVFLIKRLAAEDRRYRGIEYPEAEVNAALPDEYPLAQVIDAE
ncbi:MAG: hypothetical protein PUA86_02000 [Clostridiaceae bacterium]|nr:hypothetical protein [Clostridiaceae bacterium]